MKLNLTYTQDYADMFKNKFFVLKKMYEDKNVLNHIAKTGNKKMIYLYYVFINVLFLNNEINFSTYLQKYNELVSLFPNLREVIKHEINKSRKGRNN